MCSVEHGGAQVKDAKTRDGEGRYRRSRGFLSAGGAVQLREPHTELVTLGMSGQPGWEGCLQAKGCFSPLTCLPHGCLLKAKQTNTLKSVINQKPQRRQQAGLPTPRRCWPGLKELIPGEGWWAYVGLHIESPRQSPCRWQEPVKRKSGRTYNLQTFL